MQESPAYNTKERGELVMSMLQKHRHCECGLGPLAPFSPVNLGCSRASGVMVACIVCVGKSEDPDAVKRGSVWTSRE